MKIPVYNQKAEVVGEVELNSKIFEVKPSLHLLAEAVRVARSNSRQGTSQTKTRGEVSGGGKKPWKQKGTGRARAGSIRSPIWRHGGVSFGPRANQNWELKMNKKAKTKALFMSLSDKAASGKLVVIKEIAMEQPKTKDFAKVLGAFRKAADLGNKQMFLMSRKDDKLVRASRNIKNFTPALASNLNVVDVLKADSLMMLENSLPVLEKTFLRKDSSK